MDLAREALLAQQMLTADLAARNAELRSAAELTADALARMRADQANAGQRVQQEVTEMFRAERANTQGSQKTAEEEKKAEAKVEAEKERKALEKELKALRKEVGGFGAVKKELADLQKTVGVLVQQQQQQQETAQAALRAAAGQ